MPDVADQPSLFSPQLTREAVSYTDAPAAIRTCPDLYQLLSCFSSS